MRSQRGGILGKEKKKYIGGDVSPNRCSVPGKSRSRTKNAEEETQDLFPPAMIYEIFNPSESSAFKSHFKKKKAAQESYQQKCLKVKKSCRCVMDVLFTVSPCRVVGCL